MWHPENIYIHIYKLCITISINMLCIIVTICYVYIYLLFGRSMQFREAVFSNDYYTNESPLKNKLDKCKLLSKLMNSKNPTTIRKY